MTILQIGIIGNQYGGLAVKEERGNFFWCVEDPCGDDWEQIPESLYNEIIKFENGEKNEKS